MTADESLKFAAFYYPGYYQCNARNLAAGTSIDEWALLQSGARSVFVETDEIVPALGYTDASDPSVLEREATLARSHGVNALIFNFYFDGYNAELERPLDAFVQLDTGLEFGLNLCCHMPKRKLPFGVGEDYVSPYSYWTEEQFKALAESLCDKYFTKANYLRCGDDAVITLYHVNAFHYLYGPEGLARRVDILRSVGLAAGLRFHVIGLFSVIGGWNRLPVECWNLPFDSFSCYVVLPDFEGSQPVQSFPKLAAKWIQQMSEPTLAPNGQILVSCVGSGWNATPRGRAGYDPKIHGLRFPYFPIVVDDDPGAFEKYLEATVRHTLADSRYLSGLVLLGPWNEWSEGCFLLPDRRYGLGKLQAVKRVKDRLLACFPTNITTDCTVA